MVKKAFTLIEMIYVIVILSIIITGGMIIAGKIYKRNLIASKTLNLEFKTQQTIDQLANLLYYRIPLSAIGYNPSTGKYKYLGFINGDDNFTVFEWIDETYDIKGVNFSGFADLYASKKPVLKALDFNASNINEVLQNKFNTNKDFKDLVGIIFAGTFDRGDEGVLNDYNNSFGWHGGRADYVFVIDNYSQSGNDTNLSLKNYDGSEINNKRIYEKFYLADSAYAIALKKDLNRNKWNCSDYRFDDLNDGDLLLFYNYRPWKGETFCADGGSGNVEVLSDNIAGFYIKEINSHLEIFVKSVFKRGDITIKVSKQKVVF